MGTHRPDARLVESAQARGRSALLKPSIEIWRKDNWVKYSRLRKLHSELSAPNG